MKQAKIVMAAILTGLFLAGCGRQNISKSEAEEIALSHAGLSRDQVTFVSGEKDFEDGKSVYDVEFYTKDFREFDYQIDAKTGNILSFDADVEDYVPSAGQTPPAQSKNEVSSTGITEEQAKTMVLEKVPGAAEGDIREFKTDQDDGRLQYEGKIVYNNREYEFEINAETGEMISWDEDASDQN